MDRLDDFIKGKLENDAIEFNESHWMQASHLIEAQAQEKRRRLGFWLFTGQLAGVLALLFFILWGTNTYKTPLVDNTPIAKNKISKTSKNNQTAVINNQKATKEEEIDAKPSLQNTTAVASENQVKQPIKTKIEGKKIKPSQQQTITTTTTTTADINTASNFSNSQKKGTTDNKNKSSEVVINETKNEAPSLVIPNLIDLNTSSIHQKEEFLENPISQKRYGIAGYIPVELQLLPLDFNDDWDENLTPKENTTPLRYTLSAYAASSLYPYTQTNAKPFIGYSAGLTFALKTQKNWGVETGLRYRIRQGSFTTSQKSEQISYAFGKSSTAHSLLPKSIHTLEIPLAISYAKRKHKVSLGINYARLIGVQGDLNKTGSGDDYPTPIIEKVASGWIADNSFNKNTYAVFAGYSFAVSPVFRLSAEVHYTLGGILNKDNTSNFYIESKPIFIDFGIRYNLINR